MIIETCRYLYFWLVDRQISCQIWGKKVNEWIAISCNRVVHSINTQHNLVCCGAVISFSFLSGSSFTWYSRFTEQQKQGAFLVHLYHFQPLQENWHISRTIAPESSPLHTVSGWTRTGNLWLPSAYAPLTHGVIDIFK